MAFGPNRTFCRKCFFKKLISTMLSTSTKYKNTKTSNL